LTEIPDTLSQLIGSAREIMEGYGRDYSIGAVRSLARRNMVEVVLPPVTEGFYPIVKVHEMAVNELEEVFYLFLQMNDSATPEGLLHELVKMKVWE